MSQREFHHDRCGFRQAEGHLHTRPGEPAASQVALHAERHLALIAETDRWCGYVADSSALADVPGTVIANIRPRLGRYVGEGANPAVLDPGSPVVIHW